MLNGYLTNRVVVDNTRKKNIHYNEGKVFIMNINIDKKKMQQVGKTALKISKQIVIQGTVAVAAKGVANGLELGLNEGFDKVKKMDVDDFLGIDKQKKTEKVQKTEVVKVDSVTDDIQDGSND